MDFYIECERCAGRFIPARSTARFCGPTCRKAANRAVRQLPAEMISSARWMRWQLERRNGKWTKRPVMVDGRSAKSTDPATWSDYATAGRSKVGKGLGFALGEGIGCVDLDDSIVDGVVVPWARAILDRTPATFAEVSQSGNGLHIFGLLPERGGRVIRDGRSVEVYSSGRFIAVTGDRFEQAPSKLADLTVLVGSL